tara:strand:- start:490 stop:789 length:300 start_codon:yes stop_codon:yes gene_type:complete
MKKITWSVAALLIAGTTLFGQANMTEYEKQQEELKSFEYQVDDIIDMVRMDMYYGFLSQDKGMFYINNMVKLKSRNRDIMADLWKRRSITLGEHQAKLK